MEQKRVSIDPAILLNILLAAVVLGAIAHEFFHILTIQNPSELTIFWGNPNMILGTCCLTESEATLENIAYIIQFFVMGLWIALNYKHAVEKRL